MQLDAEFERYTRMKQQLDPMVYSCLLDLFLEMNHGDIASQVEPRSVEFMTNRPAYWEFLESALAQVKTVITPIAEWALAGVATTFHTWLMQQLPLSMFKEVHPEYSESDDLLSGATKDILEEVCIRPAPPKLQKIFAHPPLFEFCRIEIMNAEFLEMPLESIRKIMDGINLIQKIFELANGGLPQADEMTPLLNYALLASGCSQMFSFQKYLEHFLGDMPQNEIRFIEESASVALTHFVNHVSSLDEIIRDIHK
jgi:hypothetical protein